jgi:uncharacterized cupredoxin-like copper-binding protein
MSRINLCWILAVAISLLAGCGSAEFSSTPAQSLTINASEFAFSPDSIDVTSGQPVEITLQNSGAVEHDFSIQEIALAGQPRATGDTHTGGHSTGADQPTLHVAAAAGARGTLAFTPATPGQYEFVCTVAGHKEAGMVGVLNVNAPSAYFAAEPRDKNYR